MFLIGKRTRKKMKKKTTKNKEKIDKFLFVKNDKNTNRSVVETVTEFVG